MSPTTGSAPAATPGLEVALLRRRAAAFVVALVLDLRSVREELGLAAATVGRKGT